MANIPMILSAAQCMPIATVCAGAGWAAVIPPVPKDNPGIRVHGLFRFAMLYEC